MPTMGDSGIILCFSVTAVTGPMSSTFARRVVDPADGERHDAEHNQE